MDDLKLKITNDKKHVAQISTRYTPEEKTRLAKAVKDFESLLTSMMLKSMNETTEGMFGNEGYGGGVFDGIFQNEIASYMTNSRSLGIAGLMYKKLTGEQLNANVPVIQNNKSILPEPEKKKPEKSVSEIKTHQNAPAVSPSSKSVTRLEKYDTFINEAAEKFGIDKNIIKSVILAESAANDKAVSVAKAKGLMQLLDSTAQSVGVKNIWDPKENILGGTKYLSGLLRQYNGDLKLALAAYNAGPGNVNKYNGVPPFKETKNYITRVMGYLNYFNG